MLNWFVKKISKREGFTLVELVVVIAILGILAAIAVPKLATSRQNAEQKAVEANLRTIDGAITLYMAQENSAPADINAMQGKTLQSIPNGPGSAAYTIKSVGTPAELRAVVNGTVGGKTFTDGFLPLTW